MRKLHLLLPALLALGLATGMTSCSDDDDDELTEEQKEQQAIEQAAKTNRLWAIISQLAGSDCFTEDWMDQFFEPIIGQPTNGNEAVRTIVTGDLKTAAERFCNLVGIDADGFNADADYTWKDENIGTLTYKKTGGASLATVDVDIKQMPGLAQIVYKTPEQAGANGNFTGTAYYRFGDVVSKTEEDGVTDYWICVRPAFGTVEGKEDSHWVSVSPVHGKYVKEFNKNGYQHFLPVNLCTNKEHMENFAEMIYAMLNPMGYDENLQADYKKLGYFHDFHYEKTYELNSSGFFEDVASYWDSHNLFQRIFGVARTRVVPNIEEGSFNLIYGNGSIDSNGEAYTQQMCFYGKNFRTSEKMEYMMNDEGEDYDIRSKLTTDKPYIEMDYQLDGSGVKNGRFYVVRYKTGKELCKGSNPASYDKRQPLTNCQDVYVYNRDVAHLNMNDLRSVEPQKSGLILRAHYHLGDVYKDENNNRWFVVNMAGHPMERSQYAELVSFEGIETRPDGARAYDLPTRDQAIRVASFLWCLYSYVISLNNPEQWVDLRLVSNSAYNFLTAGRVDMRRLFINTLASQNQPRQDTEQACIAFNSGEYGDNARQRLLRFYCNHENEKNDMNICFWEHYPATPSPTEQFPTKFSNTAIRLQDIANEDMVKAFAEDHYARRPLQSKCGGDGKTEREPRNGIEPCANDVRNYFYDYDAWDNFQYPRDMWNAPVIVARYAVVYDRGEKQYDTRTADGMHTLSLVRERTWDNSQGDELLLLYGSLNNAIKSWETVRLDGKELTFPHWSTTVLQY